MALVMSGCSTITKSTLLGIGSGAAIGGASGALIDHQNPSQSALTAALVMGVIGGVAGYMTHEGIESRDADVRKDTLFNLEKFGVSGFSNGVKAKDNDEPVNTSRELRPTYEFRRDRR